jgi:hypothetical protein
VRVQGEGGGLGYHLLGKPREIDLLERALEFEGCGCRVQGAGCRVQGVVLRF